MTVSTAFSRRLVLAATTLAAAGLLAACGSGDDAAGHDDHAAHSHAHGASDAPTSVSAQVNSADVEFATMMIPHHQQAIEMADLVPSRTQNAWLRGFAQQVKGAQQPEIDQLTEALKSWGKPVPDSHAEHQMDGMMTPAQMADLEASSGADFDRKWITMMIAHHEGAVAMAKVELAKGENPQLRTMAQHIIDSQQAEITEMRAHLDK